jgi:hypothetical protein
MKTNFHCIVFHEILLRILKTDDSKKAVASFPQPNPQPAVSARYMPSILLSNNTPKQYDNIIFAYFTIHT